MAQSNESVSNTHSQPDPSAHGSGVRGITLPRNSVSFEGRFGRIFRALPAATYGETDAKSLEALKDLAEKMAGDPKDIEKDGPDNEESLIPALYTYFGQFVDHDITFDPASSLQQQNDPDALVDYRTPRFDLDCVYGRGPDDQPYMYDLSNGARTAKFLTAKTEFKGGPKGYQTFDLPRNSKGRAIIGDPRNDENVLVAHLQSIFHRFHNWLVENKNMSFAEAQQETRFHYQWILFHDFLPRIVNTKTLVSVLPHLKNKLPSRFGTSDPNAPSDIFTAKPELRFYKVRNEAYMPLEFSVAAYRFGHSMVRPGYRLNASTLLPIFARRRRSLGGFDRPNNSYGIDFGRFLDRGFSIDPATDNRPGSPAEKNRLQFAYRIDPSVVAALANLPSKVVDQAMPSLPERNLVRGLRLQLPNGQDVARAMGEEVIGDDKILIGKFTEDSESPELVPINRIHDGAFINNCPLWAYILAETRDAANSQTQKDFKLGPVGSRIVVETFAGLMIFDKQSYFNLDPNWQPIWTNDDGEFGLPEFVMVALGRAGELNTKTQMMGRIIADVSRRSQPSGAEPHSEQEPDLHESKAD